MNKKGFSFTGEVYTFILLALLVTFIAVICIYVYNPFSTENLTKYATFVANLFGL